MAIAAASVAPLLPNEEPRMFVLMSFAMFGGLLPDVDAEDYSLIRTTRYIWFFSLIGLFTILNGENDIQIVAMLIMIMLIFKLKKKEHRTIMHSLLGLLIFSTCILFIEKGATLAFMIGYGTHLLADSYTLKGIPLFYPKLYLVGKRKIKNGSIYESYIKHICILIIIFKILLVIGY